ncbi:MAG: polyprenyl synthetase family protein [Holosporales bacterium]|jgi:octaprenyl-diphosphate synthase|nr:polyprenyl synthetase family protein [Holosporales bacterium]
MFSKIIGRFLSKREKFDKALSVSQGFLNAFILETRIKNLVSPFSMGAGKSLRSIIYFNSVDWNDKRQYSESIYKTAALIETVHFASILHDDVIDNNLIRRNTDSSLKVHGRKKSILIGDYLLIKIVSEFFKIHKDQLIRNMFLRECSATAYGALLEQSLTIDSSVEEYIRVISLKTAPLFKISAFLGAYLASNDFAKAKKNALFGVCFGILYQIQNDLDCYKHETFHKSEDYLEDNVTFPIIILKKYFNYNVFKSKDKKEGKYKMVQNIIKSFKFQTISKEILNKYQQCFNDPLHELR